MSEPACTIGNGNICSLYKDLCLNILIFQMSGTIALKRKRRNLEMTDVAGSAVRQLAEMAFQTIANPLDLTTTTSGSFTDNNRNPHNDDNDDDVHNNPAKDNYKNDDDDDDALDGRQEMTPLRNRGFITISAPVVRPSTAAQMSRTRLFFYQCSSMIILLLVLMTVGLVYLIIDNDNVKTMVSDLMGSGLKKISTSLKSEFNATGAEENPLDDKSEY